jgi:hypothetical protein
MSAGMEHLSPAMRSRLLGWLDCAQRGWHLFPVRAGDKRPAIRAWQERATTNPDRLIAFYRDHPHHNAGVACGPSGLLVIDADMPKEPPAPGRPESGRMVLERLAGPRGGLGPTYTVDTPSGGRHLYYRMPAGAGSDEPLGNTARTLGPLLDTRGSGGYVLAPGCQLAPRPATPGRAGRPGGSYELIDDTDPAELPTWLHQTLTAGRSTVVSAPPEHPPGRVSWPRRYLDVVLNAELERVHSAGAGEHNSAVFTAARALGQLAAAGALDPHRAEDLLTRAAARIAAGPCDCTPRGLAASIRSGLAYGARRPRHLPTPVEHPDRKATA